MPDHRDHPPATAQGSTVHSEPLPDGVLLTLTGALDHHTSTQLTSSLRPIPQPAAPTVWLDLSGLSFIDSTGLTCLIQARRAVTAAGGHLALIAPSPRAQRMPGITGITGISQIFPSHPDHHSARAARRRHTRHDPPEQAD